MKARLDMDCAAEYAAFVLSQKPLQAEDDSAEWPETCSTCTTPTEDDFDPTYLSIFMPKRERVSLVLAQCSACAAIARTTLSAGAETLADRQQAGTSADRVSAEDATAFPDLQWHL